MLKSEPSQHLEPTAAGAKGQVSQLCDVLAAIINRLVREPEAKESKAKRPKRR